MVSKVYDATGKKLFNIIIEKHNKLDIITSSKSADNVGFYLRISSLPRVMTGKQK
ncbi:MAG: hypothetical protein IGBAC_0126 [Ignavibacteriae bacterium]|nr:MAG: hypothetical protein IGBAC_0126 [Ignavibacteriota bacterium]